MSCGLLETTHAAAIHADRLFIDRDSISGASAQRSKLERALKPLRGGWVHELWCADLMIVGVMFIAHPQLNPHNSRLHVLIGSALTMGAHLIATDKVCGHPNLRTVVAGMCFGSCSMALRAFEEVKESGAPKTHYLGIYPLSIVQLNGVQSDRLGAMDVTEGHAGIDASCYPTGRALVVLGLVCALFTVTIIAFRCCLASKGPANGANDSWYQSCCVIWSGASSGRRSRWRRGQRYQLIDSHSDDDETEPPPPAPN